MKKDNQNASPIVNWRQIMAEAQRPILNLEDLTCEQLSSLRDQLGRPPYGTGQ